MHRVGLNVVIAGRNVPIGRCPVGRIFRELRRNRGDANARVIGTMIVRDRFMIGLPKIAVPGHELSVVTVLSPWRHFF